MTAVLALRSALGAIDNAEAVDPVLRLAAASNPHVAGTVAGLGAADAERRRLSEQDLREIVRAEAAERDGAVSQYERAGHAGHADRLRREVHVLLSVIGENGVPCARV
jgi:hypothetical protein